jgi:hypothetical protein
MGHVVEIQYVPRHTQKFKCAVPVVDLIALGLRSGLGLVVLARQGRGIRTSSLETIRCAFVTSRKQTT